MTHSSQPPGGHQPPAHALSSADWCVLVTTNGSMRSPRRRRWLPMSGGSSYGPQPGASVRAASAAAKGEDHRAVTPCAPGPAGTPQRGPGRAIARARSRRAGPASVHRVDAGAPPAEGVPRGARWRPGPGERPPMAHLATASSSTSGAARSSAKRGARSATTAGSRRSASVQSPSSPYHHMIRASDSGDVITYLTAAASTTRSSSQDQRRARRPTTSSRKRECHDATGGSRRMRAQRMVARADGLHGLGRASSAGRVKINTSGRAPALASHRRSASRTTARP